MNKQCNAIIQSDTAGTLDRTQSELKSLRETFVVEDPAVQEIVMSSGCTESSS